MVTVGKFAFIVGLVIAGAGRVASTGSRVRNSRPSSAPPMRPVGSAAS